MGVELEPLEIQEEQERKVRLEYIHKRWTQLSELELTSGIEAVKYLLFVNSGAAAAVLTFLGNSAQVRALNWPKVMLASFMLGIVFVGLYQGVRYFRLAHIYKGWRNDVRKYYRDENWDDLLNKDERRTRAAVIPQISLACLSFVCFVFGIGLAFFNLSTLVH